MTNDYRQYFIYTLRFGTFTSQQEDPKLTESVLSATEICKPVHFSSDP